MDPLFQLPPDDLSQIEDSDLAALAATTRERVREVIDGRRDESIVGDRTQSQVSEEVEQAVLAIERIDAEIESRATADDEYDEKLAALGKKAGVEAEAELAADDETPPEDDTDDGDGDEEEEATTAAATATKRTVRPLPAARRHKPVVTADEENGLRVTQHAAGLGGLWPSMTLLNRDTLGEFLADIVNRRRVPPGQKAVLAHASYDYPQERILFEGPDSHVVNSEKIRNVLRPEALTTEALVASGALCAPLPAIYDLPGVETAARPVRAALPSFQATRGGVQVGATPTMGTYEDAVGAIPQSDNEQGGTFATKNCMRIECPDFTSVEVDSIYQCIEADNLASRSYPELMSRIADLVNAEQARLAETRMLNAIKAGSTNVTDGIATAGAVWSLIGGIYKAASGVRSRNRMPEGTALQALLPAWVIDLLALDETRAASQDNREATRAAIESLLRQAGIVPNFYLDGPSTGTGQVFAAQSAGALLEFPTEVQMAIFPAGSWLHIDSGELQLGVVRDSSLNATNDFQIFAETWENVAFTGVESLWLTQTVRPSGTFAAGTDQSAQTG